MCQQTRAGPNIEHALARHCAPDGGLIGFVPLLVRHHGEDVGRELGAGKIGGMEQAHQSDRSQR